VDAAFAGCDHVLEGEVKMGGQEHFYLEPHCSLVIPQEEDEYLCISSTQAVTKHQQVIAGCLQIPASKVTPTTLAHHPLRNRNLRPFLNFFTVLLFRTLRIGCSPTLPVFPILVNGYLTGFISSLVALCSERVMVVVL
jgi:hypothetical protein